MIAKFGAFARITIVLHNRTIPNGAFNNALGIEYLMENSLFFVIHCSIQLFTVDFSSLFADWHDFIVKNAAQQEAGVHAFVVVDVPSQEACILKKIIHPGVRKCPFLQQIYPGVFLLKRRLTV